MIGTERLSPACKKCTNIQRRSPSIFFWEDFFSRRNVSGIFFVGNTRGVVGEFSGGGTILRWNFREKLSDAGTRPDQRAGLQVAVVSWASMVNTHIHTHTDTHTLMKTDRQRQRDRDLLKCDIQAASSSSTSAHGRHSVCHNTQQQQPSTCNYHCTTNLLETVNVIMRV